MSSSNTLSNSYYFPLTLILASLYLLCQLISYSCQRNSPIGTHNRQHTVQIVIRSRVSKTQKMFNSSSGYNRLELILSMISEYNLTHLVEDDRNYTHLHNILESNFPWPLDMRWVLILCGCKYIKIEKLILRRKIKHFP